MPRLRITTTAKRDLRTIGRYVTERNPQAALRLHEALTSAMRMLSRQPLLGEVVPDLTPNLRCFPVGNYIIYYNPASGGVKIVRVIHGARDQLPAFEDSE